MVDIIAIVTAAADSLNTLGVLPYVLAGGVISLVGYFIRAAKKVGR